MKKTTDIPIIHPNDKPGEQGSDEQASTDYSPALKSPRTVLKENLLTDATQTVCVKLMKTGRLGNKYVKRLFGHPASTRRKDPNPKRACTDPGNAIRFQAAKDSPQRRLHTYEGPPDPQRTCGSSPEERVAKIKKMFKKE